MHFSKIFCSLALSIILIHSSASTTFAKTLKFAVASDTHYSLEADETSKNYTNGKKALNGFVDRMNETKYDFIIFNGDNINKSKQDHLESFLNTTKNIKTPYYIVMGNKDTHKISGIAKPDYLTTVSQYNPKQKFKNKDNRNIKNTSYYFYPDKNTIAIILDNISTGMPSTHGVFNKYTLTWLDEVLTKNAKKQAIIFQHVPYVEPFEKAEWEILEKPQYTAVIRKHNNIKMIVAGHYHKEFKNIDDYGITHIGVPALCESPYHYSEIILKYNKKPFKQPQIQTIQVTQKPAI